MKVLIVDDDKANRDKLRAFLRDLGHEVLEAGDGAEAWELMLLSDPRVVVSDWMMPRENGLELCRRVRSRRARHYVYFILLTGQMMGAERREQAMAEGVDDFLLKPWSPVALSQRLRVAERIVALNERVRALEEILPMCAYCRRIRDEKGVYSSLESYVAAETHARFSNAVCPDCAARG